MQCFGLVKYEKNNSIFLFFYFYFYSFKFIHIFYFSKKQNKIKIKNQNKNKNIKIGCLSCCQFSCQRKRCCCRSILGNFQSFGHSRQSRRICGSSFHQLAARISDERFFGLWSFGHSSSSLVEVLFAFNINPNLFFLKANFCLLF